MRTLENMEGNHLLASLLAAGCEGLRSRLELVPLAFGDVLYQADNPLGHAYFPTSAVVSVLSVMEDGASDEIAFVGSEGVVSVPLLLGVEKSPHRIVVRSAGHAYRLSRQSLLEEVNRNGTMHYLLLGYIEAVFGQISQTMACHRHHSIHQQFCRWLVSSVDRLPSDELRLTQESIALMLGLRRETICMEVGMLQAAGLVKLGRGRIIVTDRPKLEACACECYRGMKAEFGRLNATLIAASAAPVSSRDEPRALAAYVPVPRAASRARAAAPLPA